MFSVPTPMIRRSPPVPRLSVLAKGKGRRERVSRRGGFVGTEEGEQCPESVWVREVSN